MEYEFQQEHDIHPHDFDMEAQIALESLQVQVLNGGMSPFAADQYMRKIFNGFFYTVEEANGTPES
jgi:hypothetical protein